MNLSRFHINHLLLAAWILLLVILFVLAIDSIIARPGTDSSIFIYVAKGILEGDIPYLDRWDHKGPLLYVLNLFGLLIHDTWGLWLVQGVFLLGASTFAFLALRKPFGTLPALFALALFLYFFASFAPPGNYTEQYGLLFQFLTLYLFLRSHELPNPAPSHARFASLHLAIGALGAASFLLRPNLVALWIAIGLYWLFLRGSSLRKLATAVVGGGSLLILTGGLFVSIGAWSALWDAVFVFNFAQSDASLQERIGVVSYLTTLMFPTSLLVIAAWCLGVLHLIKGRLQPQRFKSIILVATILFPLELLSLSLSGYGFLHYYITALPTVAILLAFLVWFVIHQRLIPPSLLAAVLLLGVVYVSLPIFDFARLAEKYTTEGIVIEERWPASSSVRLRDLIQQSTEPDDRILVWGNGAWIYLVSGRDAPTRFFYEVPLTKPHYTNHSIHDEFLDDVREEMPELIIEIRPARVPPLASAARLDWSPRHRFAHNLDDFRPFFDLIDAHYLPVDVSWPFTIYALRNNDAEIKPPIGGELIVRSTYDVYLDGRTIAYVKEECTKDDAGKRFILQVVPVENSVINGNAHDNLDFAFMEGENWQVGKGCIVSRDLPHYPIASIRTGQYNASESAHDWLSEYQLPQ